MLRKKMASRTISAVMDNQPRSTKPVVNLGLSVLLLASTVLYVQANDINRPVIPITIPSALLHISPSALLAEEFNLTANTNTENTAHTEVTAASTPVSGNSSQVITVQPGQSLSTIFSHHKLSAKDLQKIMALGKPVAILKRLKPGQSLNFTVDNKGQLERLVLQLAPTEYLVVSRSGESFHTTTQTSAPPLEATSINNKQVAHPIAGNNLKTEKKPSTDNEPNLQFATTTIKTSLTAAAHQAGLSSKLASQLSNLFNSEVHPGDTIKVLYRVETKGGHKVSNIIAAELNHKGKLFKAIRFTDEQGHSSFYTPDGKNLSNMPFTRYPVKFTRISSPFTNMRWHPLLHMFRKHTGVDYAAPYGTPIKAAGDGRIAFVGTENGYGRAIIIRHNNQITTLYGHMSRYSKGMAPGKTVKLGQVIGYVGQSGLASGPHLHFEYRINNKPVNPLTAALPAAAPLAPKYQHEFATQVRSLMAQLNSHTLLVMTPEETHQKG